MAGPGVARRAGPGLLLLGLVLVAHGGNLSNGFVWDDERIVVESPSTRDLASMGRVLLSPDESPPYYRPLNRASYLVDYQLFGMDPRGFHAVNLVLHAADVLLLLALASRLLPGPAAFLAAALLAVHPVHAEAVAFVSARNNLFALLFMLASLILFLDGERKGSRIRGWLSGLALFLGLASKEQAAGLLPFLVLWLAVPGLSAAPPGWRRARLLLPHGIAAAAYAVLRSASLGAPVASDPIWPGLLSRLSVNLVTVPAYLRLVLWPSDLTIFHPVPPSPGAVAWLPLAWLGIAGATAWLLWTRSAPALAGLLWLGVNYLPISGLVPFKSSLVAERFFYVPAVGLWLIAGAAAAGLPRRLAGWPLGIAAGAVLAALGARTALRTRDWHDDRALARSAVAVNPRSVEARFNLGVVLKDQGDLDGARREWEAGLAIAPADAGILVQLGTLAATGGDLAAAERYYREALRSDPARPLLWYNLARICERTGRPAEALERYGRFLELARGDAESADFVAPARQRMQALRAGQGPGAR